MALIVCKECENKVSNKAKTCPNCGAKVPKKTSLFTWLVLLFIVLVVYGAAKAPSKPHNQVQLASSNANSEKANSPAQAEATVKTPPPKPAWETSVSKDEMTGKFSAYASSPMISPTQRMEFPYSDVRSWMGVGCDNESEWAYFGFTTSPNLTKDETKDGYNLISTRIKWDNQVEEVKLTQEWGSKFIHFSRNASALSKISQSGTVLLELHWHGQQSTYFEYSLQGSSKAISQIREQCAANK